MSVENSQEKDWLGLKEQYLRQIEDVLAESGQPNVDGIVNDVRSHHDRRFAELSPQQRTWENFQKIITEMGPPSDYAEFAGRKGKAGKKNVSARYVAVLAVILAVLTGAMFLLPALLPQGSMPGLTDELKRAIAPDQQADLSVVARAKTDEQKIAAAIESAKSWLQLIDEDKYGESWSQAAEFFKNNAPQQQWISSLPALRKPMGKMLSRKVINSTYTTSLPGAPDGQYVVIQFETSFENKQNAIETVTPMLESNGQWRVSGYYIK